MTGLFWFLKTSTHKKKSLVDLLSFGLFGLFSAFLFGHSTRSGQHRKEAVLICRRYGFVSLRTVDVMVPSIEDGSFDCWRALVAADDQNWPTHFYVIDR